MSCNGCRVLRKGCRDNCMLRQCLQWMGSAQAQANATFFLTKFFGRAGLMSFISSVPENQRSCLFQSLLCEAVGRTINPVGGAVGLLWTGNWRVCQAAVERVLGGGTLRAPPEFDDLEWCPNSNKDSRSNASVKRKCLDQSGHTGVEVDLGAMYGGGAVKRRVARPSEESETTTLGSGSGGDSSVDGGERKLLQLFL